MKQMYYVLVLQIKNGSENGYAMVFKYDSVNDKWVNVSGKYTDGTSYTTKVK